MSELTERDLVIAYRDAKLKKEKLVGELDKASIECDRAEIALMELLQANNATSTAKYDGIGYVSLAKPQLYASCKKDNEESLFVFLSSQGRDDLIRRAVNSRSLSGFVKELLEQGSKVPEFISYYLKPSARFYAT